MGVQTNIETRITCLHKLGEYLKQAEDNEFKDACIQAEKENPWFAQKEIRFAFHQLCSTYLDQVKLLNWANQYNFDQTVSKKVALVLAGNIPMVGFHDILCCYISGHSMQIKLSDKDKVLIPFIMRMLASIDQDVTAKIEFVDRIRNFDAVIATGSNRAGMYFETYFNDYPHIIRKNRNAIAVLDGTENQEELEGLARDIFSYYGLGCRNISKIYLKKGFKLEPLLEFLHGYNEVILHNKYKNNFDFNYALFMLNKDKFYINGALMLKQDQRIASRIASVHYEYFNDREELITSLLTHQNEIQCVSCRLDLAPVITVPFGACQKPALGQYADGVDTLQFLANL